MPSGQGDAFLGGCGLVAVFFLISLFTLNVIGMLVSGPLLLLCVLLLWDRVERGR